jgi:hypothetical protein
MSVSKLRIAVALLATFYVLVPLGAFLISGSLVLTALFSVMSLCAFLGTVMTFRPPKFMRSPRVTTSNPGSEPHAIEKAMRRTPPAKVSF